jgi:cyclopropane fatty-acyl-phospholipid synthase-like methyltransferase
MLTQNLPDFWEKLYSEDKDIWDLGQATPALKEFFKDANCPATGRVLVPGAGRGYDALAWATRGHETVAVDFCPTAVDALDSIDRKTPNFTAVDLDLFELNPKAYGEFDIIYEYGCFSALHPGRRDEYFEIWYKMLKDDGLIISLFYPINNGNTMQGPPHSTTEGELMARLGGIFDIVTKVPAKKSVKEREGQEEFWLLKKVV